MNFWCIFSSLNYNYFWLAPISLHWPYNICHHMIFITVECRSSESVTVRNLAAVKWLETEHLTVVANIDLITWNHHLKTHLVTKLSLLFHHLLPLPPHTDQSHCRDKITPTNHIAAADFAAKSSILLTANSIWTNEHVPNQPTSKV